MKLGLDALRQTLVKQCLDKQMLRIIICALRIAHNHFHGVSHDCHLLCDHSQCVANFKADGDEKGCGCQKGCVRCHNGNDIRCHLGFISSSWEVSTKRMTTIEFILGSSWGRFPLLHVTQQHPIVMTRSPLTLHCFLLFLWP